MKWTGLAGQLAHIGTLVLAVSTFSVMAHAAQLAVLDNPPLVVDPTANSAAGWLLLQNISAAPANFTLSAGPFVSLTTSQALAARISLGTSGTPYLTVREMVPGSNLPVKVDVSNFLETGEATAPVQANGAVLAVLRAERAGAPFGVTLDGTPAEKPEVAMKPDAEASLVLRNADAVNYRVGWELEAGGHVVTNGVAYLAPTSTTRLLIHPPESFLGWGLCGFMRDEWKEGKLLVWWRGADGTVKKEKVASSVHLICRPRENPDGSVRTDEIGDWRDVLQELPRRIHEWMPRLAEEGVVGADAIFACLGPALEIFSRCSRVEKASGESVTLKEYLEQVWAAVAKEALTMIFKDADTTGLEEDARLTAMWLWTLNAGNTDATNGESAEDDDTEDEPERGAKKAKITGFILEYDDARKIAQGLGAHLEDLGSLVEVSGEQARLLPVGERARTLFGKDEGKVVVARKKKEPQMDLFKVLQQADEGGTTLGETKVERHGETVLDRIHQSMILFAAGRGEALKRFLVEDGVGRDQRFWRLAQALSALYPSHTEEKRWVDGVLARKKGFGF